MSRLKSVLGNERGFMLLNVVFLTVITSFAAMILINAAPRARNNQSTLRLTAIYLANEQFAELESLAAREDISGNQPFLGYKDDLTSNNLGADNPIEFEVTTTVSGGKAKVKVTWQVGDDEFKIELERTIGSVQE